MSNVAIVTDSTTSLTKELIDEFNIKTVPVNLIIDDKIYLDGIDTSPAEYYSLLKKIKKLPTTSAPPPATFLDVYRQISSYANDILCITISSKMSAVYDVARRAMDTVKEALPGIGVHIFDSHTAADATGFKVLDAARATAERKAIERVIEVAQSIKSRVQMISMLDTLEYLVKGGVSPNRLHGLGTC